VLRYYLQGVVLPLRIFFLGAGFHQHILQFWLSGRAWVHGQDASEEKAQG